jgi:hypothetical protein
MNPTVELVLKHKKANMRKSELLMLEALKSAPHLNDISLPNANGSCDSLQFVTITGRSSKPPFAFHQQSSWLSSCLFPTCRHRPTPPNIAAPAEEAPYR